MIKTYVINMEKDVAKRKNISRQLIEQPELDWEIVNAVEGRKLSEFQLRTLTDFDKFKSKYGRRATLPALGCSMSHKLIYEKMIKDINHEFALILEDDAILHENLQCKLMQITDILSADIPVAVLLTPGFFYLRKNLHRELKDACVYRLLGGYMTSGYLINREGAKLLSEIQTPVSNMADEWDYFSSCGLNLYGITPHYISFEDGLGEIGKSQFTSQNLIGKLKFHVAKAVTRYNRYKMRRKGIEYAKKYWK